MKYGKGVAWVCRLLIVFGLASLILLAKNGGWALLFLGSPVCLGIAGASGVLMRMHRRRLSRAFRDIITAMIFALLALCFASLHEPGYGAHHLVVNDEVVESHRFMWANPWLNDVQCVKAWWPVTDSYEATMRVSTHETIRYTVHYELRIDVDQEWVQHAVRHSSGCEHDVKDAARLQAKLVALQLIEKGGGPPPVGRTIGRRLGLHVSPEGYSWQGKVSVTTVDRTIQDKEEAGEYTWHS